MAPPRPTAAAARPRTRPGLPRCAPRSGPCAHELIHDVQAQPQSLALVETGLERLEQARQQRVIDMAGIAHPQHHRAGIVAIQLHVPRCHASTHCPPGLLRSGPGGPCRLAGACRRRRRNECAPDTARFGDHRTGDLTRSQAACSRRPPLRIREKSSNCSTIRAMRRVLASRCASVCCALLLFAGSSSASLSAHNRIADSGAQVVGQHGGHRLVELQRPLERLVAGLQQLALLVQLDEDVDLAQDDLWCHRLAGNPPHRFRSP